MGLSLNNLITRCLQLFGVLTQPGSLVNVFFDPFERGVFLAQFSVTSLHLVMGHK